MVSATIRTNLGVFIETANTFDIETFLKQLKQKFMHHQDIRIQINRVVKSFPAGGLPKHA